MGSSSRGQHQPWPSTPAPKATIEALDTIRVPFIPNSDAYTQPTLC